MLTKAYVFVLRISYFNINSEIKTTSPLPVIYRPGVAKAVLQTPSSLTDWLTDELTDVSMPKELLSKISDIVLIFF